MKHILTLQVNTANAATYILSWTVPIGGYIHKRALSCMFYMQTWWNSVCPLLQKMAPPFHIIIPLHLRSTTTLLPIKTPRLLHTTITLLRTTIIMIPLLLHTTISLLHTIDPILRGQVLVFLMETAQQWLLWKRSKEYGTLRRELRELVTQPHDLNQWQYNMYRLNCGPQEMANQGHKPVIDTTRALPTNAGLSNCTPLYFLKNLNLIGSIWNTFRCFII